MSWSPGGRCEWCGGPQRWTIIAGEMYTACTMGCAPIPGLGFDPPPDSELACDVGEGRWQMELSKGGGVLPPEGGDADETERSVLTHIGVPLSAVLLNLWTGGPSDG